MIASPPPCCALHQHGTLIALSIEATHHGAFMSSNFLVSAPSPFRFTHHAVAAAVAAMLAAPHFGALAQDGKLTVINVTAERRLENLQQVPVSASVLQGEILDVINTGGQDLRGLSARVPSLNIESSFGRAFPRFYIRGYGNTDFRLNASQPVSLVYDDVVQENPILKGFPAFDLERIEVLRGPQGTLFGRNTPAGVVKFESVKPGKVAEGYGSLSFGNYSTINLEGAATVPLSDTVSTRISLLNQRRSDWVDNTEASGPTQSLEGYRDTAVRGQLLYEPHKDFSALLNVHHRDLSGSARLFRANIIKPGTNDLVDGFDERKITNDGKNESELTNTGANARLRWNLGPLSLFSVTGYETLDTFNRGDIDGGVVIAQPFPTPNITRPGFIPFSSETADGIPSHSQFTQEFRLESNYSGPLNWQAGLFAFIEDYTVESFSYDTPNGSAQDGYQRITQTNDAYAIFGALTYDVSPALRLRGGLRYTYDKKELNVEAYSNSGFAPCFGPSNGIIPGPPRCTLEQLAAAEPDGDLSASPSDSKFSWDVSATYVVNKDVNVYARIANGFRASSIQSASAFNGKSVADPETNTSFEAGFKADLFDRQARLNFAAFSYRVDDLQLTAVGGAGNANILLNADRAKGKGFELDFQAYLTERLLASVGVGYNDTEIDDAGLAVSVCAACKVTDPLNADGKALINGNPLPQAPKTTANFTLRYGMPIAGGEAYAFTDWVYRSKVNFFLYESVEFTSKSLTEGGLRLGYTWGGGKYDAAAFVRNITDQVRVVGGIDFNNLTGFVNDPRTYGLQFRAQF
jgi:iron complex outermembrane receptor protein